MSYLSAEKDARLGLPYAQFVVGKMYIEGVQIDKNVAEGMQWIRKAVLGNNDNALDYLADLNWFGIGMPQNKDEAFGLYKKAAALGNIESRLKVGIIQWNEVGLGKLDAGIQELQKLADSNKEPRAQALLGWAYWKGRGVRVDLDLAKEYLTAARKQEYELGVLYLSQFLAETGARKDSYELLEFLVVKQAGPVDNNLGTVYSILDKGKLFDAFNINVKREANYEFGRLIYSGEGEKVNEEYGVELLRRAALAEHPLAAKKLASIYVENPELVKGEDYAELPDKLKVIAEQEDSAIAATALAKMYALGYQTIVPDPDAVRTWVSKALSAKQDKDTGYYALALMAQRGEAFEKNPARAFKLLSQINNDTMVEKDLLLGEMYFTGEGTVRDYDKAFEIFKRLQQTQNTQVLYRLAYLYENGLGVTQDDEVAERLYKVLAQKGHAPSLFGLAKYAEKNGDYKNALEFYTQSATRGYVKAQERVGDLYQKGLGARRDTIRAYGWYLLAQHPGNVQVEQKLAQLGQTMEARDMLRARVYARDLKQRVAQTKNNMNVDTFED